MSARIKDIPLLQTSLSTSVFFATEIVFGFPSFNISTSAFSRRTRRDKLCMNQSSIIHNHNFNITNGW